MGTPKLACKLEFTKIFHLISIVGSVAERLKESFLRRTRLHDRGSTRTLVTLLRPWIRRFTMIISAWWLRTSSKFMWEEFIRQPENLENGQLLSECGFVKNKSATVVSGE